MARVTVEDCVEKVPNKFDLVLLAAQRAREIAGGAELTLSRDNDKDHVVALREIADGTVSVNSIEDSLIRSLQRNTDKDNLAEDELMSLLGGDEKEDDTAIFAAPSKAADVMGAIFEDMDLEDMDD